MIKNTIIGAPELRNEIQVVRHEVLLENKEKLVVREFIPIKALHKTPVIIASGWSLSDKPYHDLADGLAMIGHRVFTFDAPYGVRCVESHTIVPLPILRRIEVLKAIINSQKLGKVNIVAHSEGALYTAHATKELGSHIGDIVLLAPSGIIELNKKHRYPSVQLTKQYIQELINQIHIGAKEGRTATEFGFLLETLRHVLTGGGEALESCT